MLEVILLANLARSAAHDQGRSHRFMGRKCLLDRQVAYDAERGFRVTIGTGEQSQSALPRELPSRPTNAFPLPGNGDVRNPCRSHPLDLLRKIRIGACAKSAKQFENFVA